MKQMYRISFLTFVFVVVAFSSCQSDIVVTEDTPVNINIPSPLVSYFETFAAKAGEYGIKVDYAAANVTAEISNINQGSVAGSCTTNNHDLKHIMIDQSFWNQASQALREMVIFHELGHCVLGRGHREDAFNNGFCKSIMRSGLGTCKDAYTTVNRDYYLDELFTVSN